MSSLSDDNIPWAALAYHMSSSFGHFNEPLLPFHMEKRQVHTCSLNLPMVQQSALAKPFSQLIVERQSLRDFGHIPLCLMDVQLLLQAGYGRVNASMKNNLERRTVPSAGGLYPLRMVLWARAVAGMTCGFYEGATEVLVKLGTEPPEKIENWFHTRHVPYEQAAAIIFLLADTNAVCPKYGERGYRYALIEAGHVGQNICLAAQALEIPHIPIGGFDDESVNKALSQSPTEFAVYSVVMGCR